MTDKPTRWKGLEEMTVEEHIEALRDPTARFETADYIEARRQAIAEAGLEPEDEFSEQPPPEAMTPSDHLRAINERSN